MTVSRSFSSDSIKVLGILVTSKLKTKHQMVHCYPLNIGIMNYFYVLPYLLLRNHFSIITMYCLTICLKYF